MPVFIYYLCCPLAYLVTLQYLYSNQIIEESKILIVNLISYSTYMYLASLRKINHTFVQLIQNQYKFYVDFKGLLYFDDSAPFIFPNCIKDKKFINEMYKKIQHNMTDSDQNYPFLAQFWGQRNYIRSAISPIIFHSLNQQTNELKFSFEQASKFDPSKLQVDGDGRIWHPYRQGIKGVFSNELIAQILENVKQKDGKTFIRYNDGEYLIEKID